MNLQKEDGKSFRMGQKKKMRSSTFLQRQVDDEMLKRVSDRVKRIKDSVMQDYLDRKKKKEGKEKV